MHSFSFQDISFAEAKQHKTQPDSVLHQLASVLRNGLCFNLPFHILFSAHVEQTYWKISVCFLYFFFCLFPRHPFLATLSEKMLAWTQLLHLYLYCAKKEDCPCSSTSESRQMPSISPQGNSRVLDSIIWATPTVPTIVTESSVSGRLLGVLPVSC